MSVHQSTTDPFGLLECLRELDADSRVWVGFSGGLDSTVLLHSLAELRERLPCTELRAVHVNHGLQQESAAWAAGCRDICRDWQVPLAVLSVDARPAAGEGIEAGARRQRYAALAALLATDECLLTAHHQDDQAETVLLNLMRGSGVTGLGGMRRQRNLDGLHILRPLLGVPRADLEDYARHHALAWVDDPSNRDQRLQRNYIRHSVMASMQAYRPGTPRVIARAARHLQDASDCLEDLGRLDLLHCGEGEEIRISTLLGLSLPRQRNLLRVWLRTRGRPPPQARQLDELLQQLSRSGGDSKLRVCWSGMEVRRHRDRLFAMSSMPAKVPGRRLNWNLERPLILPNGHLRAQISRGEGVSADACRNGRVEVRFRRGGEHCTPAGRGHRHSLKKLLQEMGLPPWLRPQVPLVYIDEELACVADLLVCEPFQAGQHEDGWNIRWSRS